MPAIAKKISWRHVLRVQNLSLLGSWLTGASPQLKDLRKPSVGQLPFRPTTVASFDLFDLLGISIGDFLYLPANPDPWPY